MPTKDGPAPSKRFWTNAIKVGPQQQEFAQMNELLKQAKFDTTDGLAKLKALKAT